MHLCVMNHWLYLYPVSKHIASAHLSTAVTPKAFWSTSTEKADHQHKPATKLLPKVGASRKDSSGLFLVLFFFFLP